jgi:hypothetical protein
MITPKVKSIVELWTNAQQYCNVQFVWPVASVIKHQNKKITLPSCSHMVIFERKWLVRACYFSIVHWYNFFLRRKSPHQIFIHNFKLHTETPGRQCVRHFKDGNTDIADQPRGSHPQIASTERNKGKNQWAHQFNVKCWFVVPMI